MEGTHESSQNALIKYAVKKGNQQMINPPTIIPTVLAALVSAWNLLAWNLPVFVRRDILADAAEDLADPALDEVGDEANPARLEWIEGVGDNLLRSLLLTCSLSEGLSLMERVLVPPSSDTST